MTIPLHLGFMKIPDVRTFLEERAEGILKSPSVSKHRWPVKLRRIKELG